MCAQREEIGELGRESYLGFKNEINCLKRGGCYLETNLSEQLTWRRKEMTSRMMITNLLSGTVSRFTSISKTPEWTRWISWLSVPPLVKLATTQRASFWTLNSPCRKRTFTFFTDPEELKYRDANLV